MTDYLYPSRTAALTNAKLLRQQIGALALPGWTDFGRDVAGVLHVPFPADLTAPQKASLDTVIANHNPSQQTAEQQAQIDAANAYIAAINLDPPISDLQSARAALVTARTALAAALTSLHTTDGTIQAFAGTATAAQLTAGMKQLSAAVRVFCDAQADGDQALADGEQALANALQALKVRFA